MMRASHAVRKPQRADNLCSCICRLFILPFLFASSLLFASTGSFIGPGGGGSFFEPTVSSLDPNRVLVACDMMDGYFSESGGKPWRSFNLRGRIRFFAFDPVNAKVLYAKSIGLWRSADAGITWSLIYPDPREVTGIEMHGDHAGEKLITSPSRPPILALAVAPGNSKTLFAAFGDQQSAQQPAEQSASFAISTDSGKTWGNHTPLPPGTHRLLVDPTPGIEAPDIYAVGKVSMAARLRGKWVEVRSPAGVKELSDVAVGFSANRLAKLYLVADGELFVSSDSGTTWQKSSLPGVRTEVRAIAASPDHPNIAYASFRGRNETFGATGATAATYLGVARTEDGGATWKVVRKESGSERKAFGDDWIGEFFGSGYAAAPIALAVAPHHPMTVYSTDAGRVLRSDDGGEHWRAIYTSRLGDGTFSGIGLEGTTAHGVHFDPFDSRRIFISYTDIGLFRSDNGGAGWLPSTEAVPHAWLNTTYWMVFDPSVRGRAWAVMSGTHDLPRTKVFDRKSSAAFVGGVMISADGGKTWRKSNDGMPPTAPTHILLDPGSPPDARVLYVAACGKGVYKSVNGGKTWELKNDGIADKEPLAWRMVRDSSGGLYVILVRRKEEAPSGSADDGALYYSADAAAHWRRIALPEAVNAPNGLAMDPKNPNRLYLAAWGRFTPAGQQGGGIYLSTDRGKSWSHVLGSDQHIFDVTVDERSPNVAYAAGFESSAWRSKDAGLSWQRIPGFNFKWGQRVIPDTHDASKVYITTFGGGVWHGPAEGDSSNFRDIKTPVVAHSRSTSTPRPRPQ
jgi:photosystem II stability/assembly factor-like uncharacterized protein